MELRALLRASTIAAVHARIPFVGSSFRSPTTAFRVDDFPAPVSPNTTTYTGCCAALGRRCRQPSGAALAAERSGRSAASIAEWSASSPPAQNTCATSASELRVRRTSPSMACGEVAAVLHGSPICARPLAVWRQNSSSSPRAFSTAMAAAASPASPPMVSLSQRATAPGGAGTGERPAASLRRCSCSRRVTARSPVPSTLARSDSCVVRNWNERCGVH